MDEFRVDSLHELSGGVKAFLDGAACCFRGQSDASWPLTPSAFRDFPSNIGKGLRKELCKIERDTYREFGLRIGKAEPNTSVANMCAAQHNGLPTRLLDWTRILNIAVFFAVSKRKNTDAAVWCLNLRDFPFDSSLGRQLPEGGFPSGAIPADPVAAFQSGRSNTQTKEKSVFIVARPPDLNDRIKRQEALLAWHHSYHDEDCQTDYTELVRQAEAEAGKQLLLKVVVPKDRLQELKEEIAFAGITHSKLFPDPTGIAAELAQRHHERVKELVSS